MTTLRLLVLSTVLVVPACESGDDAAADAGPGTPDANLACPDPSVALPTGWQPVAMISTGPVATVESHGIFTSSVDATAGGFGGSANEPFVYVKFGSTTLDKVAITDVESFGSTAWDLAFKRYVIRANGGDSGPGGVTVASQAAATLDVVALPPPSTAFSADDFASETCQPLTDALGAPLTAVGSWYTMNGMTLVPMANVYVVKLADGSHVKFRVVTYYGDPLDPARSAFFSIEWAAL